MKKIWTVLIALFSGCLYAQDSMQRRPDILPAYRLHQSLLYNPAFAGDNGKHTIQVGGDYASFSRTTTVDGLRGSYQTSLKKHGVMVDYQYAETEGFSTRQIGLAYSYKISLRAIGLATTQLMLGARLRRTSQIFKSNGLIWYDQLNLWGVVSNTSEPINAPEVVC